MTKRKFRIGDKTNLPKNNGKIGDNNVTTERGSITFQRYSLLL